MVRITCPRTGPIAAHASFCRYDDTDRPTGDKIMQLINFFIVLRVYLVI